MKTAVKRLYEGLFLVDSAWAASEWETVLGTIRKFLERAGADIESIKKWDDRRLAYEVEGKAAARISLRISTAARCGFTGLSGM